MPSETQHSPVERETSTYHPLQTFHPFSRLPNELQDIIWEFAIIPRIIRFELADPPDIISDTTPPVGQHEIRSNPEVLLSVCHASHAAAVRVSGGVSTFIKIGSRTALIPDPDPEPRQSPLLFHFVPKCDTIYLPDIMAYQDFIENGCIEKKEHGGLITGLAAVRSLALGGLLHRFWYSHESIDYGQYSNNDPTLKLEDDIFVALEQLPRISSISLLYALSKFPRLEELVFVLPPAAQWTEIDNEYHYPLLDFVTCTDPAQCEERVKKFPKEVERLMSRSKYVKKLLQGINWSWHVASRVQVGIVSEWWQKPRVSMMTEEEFNARFI
ncbi:hypothetical protein EG329_008790 [Mollisiaceae sp. DMI_Dod_QoI]|nr:hypothetical protein EG329_008790 [Helotiales sp. DMI_Dod_QoI]